jgi:hypothetical protein
LRLHEQQSLIKSSNVAKERILDSYLFGNGSTHLIC